MKKQLFLTIVFAIAIQIVVLGQSGSYKEKVSTMISLNGSEATFKTVIEQMINQFQQMNTNVPQDFWKEMKSEFLKTSMKDLVDLIVPIYYKHLTEDDLDGIIAFYKTPVGRKFAEKTPVITQESMLIGQQWGMQISQKIAASMKEKGY